MNRHIMSLSVAASIATPAVALAGMPSVDLTDVARMRIETLSFFLVVFLACGKGLQLLWNWLRNDFTRLPRLSYCKALGLLDRLGPAVCRRADDDLRRP